MPQPRPGRPAELLRARAAPSALGSGRPPQGCCCSRGLHRSPGAAAEPFPVGRGRSRVQPGLCPGGRGRAPGRPCAPAVLAGRARAALPPAERAGRGQAASGAGPERGRQSRAEPGPGLPAGSAAPQLRPSAGSANRQRPGIPTARAGRDLRRLRPGPARPGAARAGGAYPACCCCCWRRPARARSRSPRSRRWGWESPLCAEREQRRRRCAGPSPAGQDTRPRRPSAPGWGRETPPRRGPAPAAPLRRGGGGAASRGGTGHPRAVLRLDSCSLGPGGIARSPSGDPAPCSAPPALQPAAPGHLLSCLTSLRGPAVGPRSFISFLIFTLGLGLLPHRQPLANFSRLPGDHRAQLLAVLSTTPRASASSCHHQWPPLFLSSLGYCYSCQHMVFDHSS